MRRGLKVTGGLAIAAVIAVAGTLAFAGALSSTEQPALRAAAPRFDPNGFFAGQSRGEGAVHVLLSDAKGLHVQSEGRIAADGTLILDQVIRRDGAKIERRQWTIRATGAGRYGGTLSSATSPIDGVVDGNCLHLRFRMKGGLDAEQWIYLQPDGRTALNRMSIGKFGIAIAKIEETIRKVDQAPQPGGSATLGG